VCIANTPTAMAETQSSFSWTTFSPSGKLVQIEYALNAVGSGQTSLGIRASNGVVLASEKKLPSVLVDDSTVKKIHNLTEGIGVVYSGARTDLRLLPKPTRNRWSPHAVSLNLFLFTQGLDLTAGSLCGKGGNRHRITP